MGEIGHEVSILSTPQVLKKQTPVIVNVVGASPEELKQKDVIYQFYHDCLAPFIVALSVKTLDKLKVDSFLKIVVFRRDGVQIDVALQKMRQLPEYSEIPVERIQRLDLTKPVMNAALKDKGQRHLVEQYLEQAGLRNSSPILFADTGFSNTIPRRLKEDFLPGNTQTVSMFLVSMNQQATGVIYDHQSIYAHPNDQVMKPEAGAVVSILESLGKGVRNKITRLVQDKNGKIHGEFSREKDENYRRENLTALRAIVDYIDEQPKEDFVEKHRDNSFLTIKRRQMEEKLNTMQPIEKIALKIDVPPVS